MRSQSEKVLTIIIRLSIPIWIIGALCKIMHWPSGNFIIVIAMTMLAVFSLVRFFILKKVERTDYIRLALNVSFAVYYTFSILHWPGKIYPGIILGLSVLLWLWYDGLSLNKGIKSENGSVKKRLSNVLFIGGGLLTAIGMLFKIMHWPGAGLILIVGLLAITISFFTGVANDE